ncbi:uncharacterized protein [Primulina huaijiensis]|uniref:uncharacterized protein n=1 Tax=Primulina huaijiensis TaxID=1492673 RepID=UPI003CC6F488
MPSAAPAAAAAAIMQNQNSTPHPSFKTEPKLFSQLDLPSSSSSAVPVRIDGFEEDLILSKSQFLTRPELLKRRSRRVKQLARIYRDHYWALMEELKFKYREYYWEFGKSPFQEDEEGDRTNWNRGDCTIVIAENAHGNDNNGNPGVTNKNNSRCGVHGCKAKAMAMTRFCHMHILSDAKQKLYKACNFSIKSSTTGPILCGKPILRSTVPSYCPIHFQKAEKHMACALKRAGLNVSSASKLAPKLHILIAEYVRQIKHKRRAARKSKLEHAVVKKENNS